ncbi:2-phosphosulfolactate phosphatase [Kitasatospora sp. NBC_01287]|uniref:2-phosphosulfolactate phosphatase n=1 Tax=Kitasatospora sp. NBC_01287 TaxID=2903573 RepID=UPI002254FA33|nr:2-phosphosulfolactate phosphatase [Kitasatospora sp. NBC_01287]MCX4751208.1 2-phosphosulfolactate phosphatase [Kitasatospora sp. NBC_01287]
MSDWFLQQEHGVRFDWGPTGAQQLAENAACLVVVDVLSFTTSVTVAVEAGTQVFPYAWRDETASAFAQARTAVLAAGRRAATSTSPWSLSPAALRQAPFTPRLVLPSPNGSAIAAAAGDSTVVAGCLRNATAVGRWLARHRYGTAERPVVVIAAGERWPDGTLRPALEDLLGAGAIIAELGSQGVGPLSPEAAAARACFTQTSDVSAAVAACSSGIELIRSGFADDVAVATELDASTIVPVLTDGAFRHSADAARPQPNL